MRVVVTGATGNVGTAVLREILPLPDVDFLVAMCRRRPERWPGDLPAEHEDAVTWYEADVGADDLAPALRQADAVVHLAWLFQPTHRPDVTWQANVVGSRRVLQAAADAGVRTVVVASSVGAYSPRTSLDPVDETYPTDGNQAAAYSREKAYLERMLDAYELAHPGIRVVRMRPGFIFQRSSATEQRRLFGGPLVPERLLTRLPLPLLPDPGGQDGLHLQALHAADAARAYRLALTEPVSGAFNLAADPVIDLSLLAERYGSRRARVPYPPARAVVSALWRAHLVPAAPGLLDLVASLVVMSTTRAREELGWEARHSGLDALDAVLEGLRSAAGGQTPPLARETSGTLRSHELGTGSGSRP